MQATGNLIKTTYPNATVAFVGHSLGGALAALTVQTLGGFGISFNAPADELALGRIGVKPNGTVFQYGSQGDTIFRGRCNYVSLSHRILSKL